MYRRCVGVLVCNMLRYFVVVGRVRLTWKEMRKIIGVMWLVSVGGWN